MVSLGLFFFFDGFSVFPTLVISSLVNILRVGFQWGLSLPGRGGVSPSGFFLSSSSW